MSGFVRRNKPAWDELERLLHQARKGVGSMSPDQLSRIDVLYRRTSVHLAQVATRSRDKKLISYLNDLTVAAHSLIYLPPRRSAFAGLQRFIVDGFARSIARNLRVHATAVAILIGGALFGYFAASVDIETAYALWSADDPRRPGSTPEQLLEFLRGGRDEQGGKKFFFASYLFEHNFKAGLLMMATGFLAGVPTVLFTFYNGMLLGVFMSVHHRAGIYSEAWAWILPHGITEFGALALCSGVGLLFGRAVLSPGLMNRTDALRATGREAVGVALGAAFMLVAAAVIESYLRQSHLSTPARFTFAAGTALFWALFISYGYVRERAARRAALETGLAESNAALRTVAPPAGTTQAARKAAPRATPGSAAAVR